MITPTETGFLQRPDGTRLFWRFARPTTPRSLVVIAHGLAEHSGRYSHVMAKLVTAGHAVIAPDHRGHGQSSGKRVYIDRFRDYTDDLQAIVAMGRAKLGTDVPVALLGHSMGGLIVIGHVMDHPSEANLLMVSSPGLGVAIAVPKWKDMLGRVMSRVWPSLAIPTGLSAALVSRDPAVVKAYETDPLVTKNATARWYTEFLDTQARAMAAAPSLSLPVCLQFGGKDGLVSLPAQKTWFERLGSRDKELQDWPELFHEIMNEPEQDAVIARYVAWLDRHT
jgi:alpha-beta hydrolase superfamily lysophospholipase